MMRRASRIDATHTAIVEALRACGCSVVSLAAVGKGCPDLLVSRGGKTWLVECKTVTPRKTKAGYIAIKAETRKKQEEFRAAWSGRLVVVTSAEEAVASVGEGEE